MIPKEQLAILTKQNTFTRKQTFQPSVNETAAEMHGFDTTVKSEVGGDALVLTGGDSSQGYGGKAISATGGDGQGNLDGTAIEAIGGGTDGDGIHAKAPTGVGGGYPLVAESTALPAERSPGRSVALDVDPEEGNFGDWFITGNSHPTGGGGRVRARGRDFENANVWVNVDRLMERGGRYSLQTPSSAPVEIAFYQTQANERGTFIHGFVVAREAATDDAALYELTALYDRSSGGTLTAKYANVNALFEDQAAWNVTFNIDSGVIRIRVVGEDGKDIDWDSFLEASEFG